MKESIQNYILIGVFFSLWIIDRFLTSLIIANPYTIEGNPFYDLFYFSSIISIVLLIYLNKKGYYTHVRVISSILIFIYLTTAFYNVFVLTL